MTLDLMKGSALGALAVGLSLIVAPDVAHAGIGAATDIAAQPDDREPQFERRNDGSAARGERRARPPRGMVAPSTGYTEAQSPQRRRDAQADRRQERRVDRRENRRGNGGFGSQQVREAAQAIRRDQEAQREARRQDRENRQSSNRAGPSTYDNGQRDLRGRRDAYRDQRGTYRDNRRDGDRTDRQGSYRDQRDAYRAGRRDGYRTDQRGDYRNQQRAYRDGRRDAYRAGQRARYHDGRRWHDYRVWDRSDWRRHSRYDWYRYRSTNRNLFSIGRYYAPYRNYRYSRIGIGFYLDQQLFGSRYWINDPWRYRLPEVYGPYRWVRYYDDVLLVDVYNGEVVDVIYDFFW